MMAQTRFIEHMAYGLGLPLVTISCHEDLTLARPKDGNDLLFRESLRLDPFWAAISYWGHSWGAGQVVSWQDEEGLLQDSML